MTEWGKARKKPVTVKFREVEGEEETIETREGTLKAYKGKDFIIKGVEGELYPISREIFFKTYDVLSYPGESENG